MAQTNIRVGNVRDNSGEINIAGGDIYKGFTAEQVSVLLTQIATGYQPKPFDGRCPYKGLDVFQEEDAGVFFGRERLVEDLVHRVKECRTVFITGPSGSGKSSLVRAGLIHQLRQGAIADLHSEDWSYATMNPGRAPLEGLAVVFSRLKSPELGDYFRQNVDQVGVLNTCAESALTDRKDQRLVLFLDQFEEVFTQVGKEAERTAFFNLLTQAAAVENGRVAILFAMRSDFVSICATYPQLNALLNQQFVQIGAMEPAELVSAIARPALRVGLRIDPDLVAQIISDMKGEPGALPLMQFALKDLFDAQQAKGGVSALTREAYLERGGIDKALQRHADDSFARLDIAEQDVARSIFGSLIEIGSGTVDTRRTSFLDELIPADAQAGEVKTIIQKLADARLITTDEQAGKDTVTISHEKLIDAWPWLKKLVNENRDVIALQNQIAKDAKEWDEHQRDASYLYTGARLGNAQEKLQVRKLILNELAQIYIHGGIELEDAKLREKERRQQKELEDARKLAATAQAQARAERRARQITVAMLVMLASLLILVGYQPVRNGILRQQAMGSALISIPKSEPVLGDSRYTKDNPAFLPRGSYALDAFQIDPYEVSNSRYLLCVKAGVCSYPLEDPKFFTAAVNAELPVVNISAIQASQFCRWLGRDLPNDLQWERAARYTDERTWPWGKSAPSVDNANLFFDNVQVPTQLKPIGQYKSGTSLEGAYDLAGNVWEWTRSDYYQYQSELDMDHFEIPKTISVRGGSYETNPQSAMSDTIAFRLPSTTYQPNKSIGFRCVSR